MGDGIEQIRAARNLIERTQAQFGQQRAHVLGHVPEVVDESLRLIRETQTQVFPLGCDSDRTGVQMALAGHHTGQRDQRRRPESKLIRAQDRRHHHVASRLHPSVGAQAHALAETVGQQSLVRFGQP